MEKVLPDKYRLKLKEGTIPGVKSLVWTRELLQEFIEDEESLCYAILGGSVIEVDQLEMKYSGDGWYISKRNLGESFQGYSLRGNIMTKEYLQNYPSKPNILFEITFTSEVTAGL